MYKEIFLPIKDFEGFYEISNAGRIRSLERKAKYWRGGYKTIEERILKPQFYGHKHKQYLVVGLYKDGKVKIHKIHQLVLNHFKPNPDPSVLTDIDHIRGGDRTCNFITSLEWVTRSENVKRGFRRDGRKPSIPLKGISRIRAVVQIDKITSKILAEFESTRKAGRETGINQSNICRCCKGQRKLAGNFVWKYKN